jgi:hypothetical protein
MDPKNVRLDEAIADFRRDAHPEKEVEVWERIAHVFQHFTTGLRRRASDADRCCAPFS